MADDDRYDDLPRTPRQPGSRRRMVQVALGPGGPARQRQSDDAGEGAGGASKLIKTGEIVSLGMPYDTQMPIAPGRAYALRMPGGPTGGPYGGKSRRSGTTSSSRPRSARSARRWTRSAISAACAASRGDKTKMLFYNGNKLSDMWSPYGLKKLGMENAPPFFTRGVLFDVQGLKGRVLDVGEEIKLADLKACLERQGSRRSRSRRATRRSCAPATASRWYTETDDLLRRRARHRPRMRALVRRACKSASSAPTISRSRSCRRSIRRCSIPATSTSS